ncbi:MAG: lactate utilization protein [Phycisphaerales bacterium]|nr:lactate utilization protein [Phycisphaerales bacterium]NNM25828.1 lactate utilization protein [Phycisphaerales bacterium]
MSNDTAPSGPGLSRDVFVARIRAQLDASGPPGPPPSDSKLVRRVEDGADLVAEFASRATEAGMAVETVSPATLRAQLASRLDDVKRVTVSMSPGPRRDAVIDVVTTLGIEIIDWRRASGVLAHYDADVGITDVAAAVAETGTLVLSSGEHHSRGAFMVPPRHLAIVPRAAIVADLVDLLAAEPGRPPHERPAATVLVSGPSKTADIEGILITGVHGPGRVEVLVVV